MKSESMWDRLANNYDTPGVSLGENDIKIVKKTKKYLDASSVLLDYGCATGSIVIELAGMVKEAHGIDISSKMVALARKKAVERSANNTNFIHATIFDERLKPETYDLILAVSVLHLVEDFTQVVARIHQLLKPGGIFITATPCLGKTTFISGLISVPLFLLSKIGILPHINFFSSSVFTASITNQNFQIIENQSVSGHSTTECFIIAKKT